MTEWTHWWYRADGKRVRAILLSPPDRAGRTVKIKTARNTVCWAPIARLKPIEELP
jgi:hypothetical protein